MPGDKSKIKHVYKTLLYSIAMLFASDLRCNKFYFRKCGFLFKTVLYLKVCTLLNLQLIAKIFDGSATIQSRFSKTYKVRL